MVQYLLEHKLVPEMSLSVNSIHAVMTNYPSLTRIEGIPMT